MYSFFYDDTFVTDHNHTTGKTIMNDKHLKKGLTWTLFEQIKRIRSTLSDRPARDIENSIMGCMASATTVCIMIPMDTVKTRLVTQFKYSELEQYKGIADCFSRVLKEEGVGAFYRGLWPRLLSVVPMIGIQFGVYEVIYLYECHV